MPHTDDAMGVHRPSTAPCYHLVATYIDPH